MQPSFASFIATVVEAEVDEHGHVHLRRITSAVDTGIAINPDTVMAQLEGGLIFGLTAALFGVAAELPMTTAGRKRTTFRGAGKRGRTPGFVRDPPRTSGGNRPGFSGRGGLRNPAPAVREWNRPAVDGAGRPAFRRESIRSESVRAEQISDRH